MLWSKLCKNMTMKHNIDMKARKNKNMSLKKLVVFVANRLAFSLKTISNKKYNCSRPPEFKSKRVRYQSNQKLLHHYQNSKNQLNLSIHS